MILTDNRTTEETSVGMLDQIYVSVVFCFYHTKITDTHFAAIGHTSAVLPHNVKKDSRTMRPYYDEQMVR